MRVVAMVCLSLLIPGIAAAAPAPAPVPAEPVPGTVAGAQIPPGLVLLLNRPDHQAAVLQALHAVDDRVPDACHDASYASTGEVELLVPLAEGPDGQPTAGVWRESAIETGCRTQRVLNVLTMVEPGGRLASRPLLPGTTITDPQLQRDSVRYAAAGLGPLPPGCQQGAVTDTAYLGLDGQPPGTLPTAGAPIQPWNERWTLEACNKHVVVGMHFTPDPNGATEIQATPPAGN